jgi:hypothetical protein
MKTEPKRFSYGVGALAILAVSVGVAAVVYGLGLLPFDLYILPAWILGPLGVYTAVYSLAAGSESTYYVVWGTVMVALALISALYNIAYVIPVLGVLVIILAVIGVIAYMRGKR